MEPVVLLLDLVSIRTFEEVFCIKFILSGEHLPPAELQGGREKFATVPR